MTILPSCWMPCVRTLMMPHCGFDLESRLYGDSAIPQGGSVAVPQSPGLGFDPDADVIRRYRAK